jgi:hypothetical protein
MDRALEDLAWKRAGGRCEYCRISSTNLDLPFAVDHIMDAVLRQLGNEGCRVRNEDIARLSPTMRPNIKMLGRHSFALPEAVARNELRPLRDPTQTMEEAA